MAATGEEMRELDRIVRGAVGGLSAANGVSGAEAFARVVRALAAESPHVAAAYVRWLAGK